MKVVDFSRTGAVGLLTLQRPQAHNAIDGEMARQLHAVAGEFERERGLCTLIMTGAGDDFSVGGDIDFFYDQLGLIDHALDTLVQHFHGFILALRRTEAVVIAAIEGAAAGGGLAIALAADLAIASRTAKFTTAYLKLGLSPDGGTTYFLPRLVGPRRATELLMGARVFDGEEAHRLGIVNAVVPAGEALAEAQRVAQTIASSTHAAISTTKRLIEGSSLASLEQHLDTERAALIANATSPAFAERLAAFVQERRKRGG